MAREASANWSGGLKEGNGTMALGTGSYEGAYTYKSRFEEGAGTNPEELLAAAHAGCFTMGVAAYLEANGHTAESLQTDARVTMRLVDNLPTITKIGLKTRGRVPGLDQEGFEKAAQNSKENCIISRAVAGGVAEITLEATLED